MVKTKQTLRCYHSKEEEEEAIRRMEKRREEMQEAGKELEEEEIADTGDSQVEIQESQKGDSQETEEGVGEPPRKKKKQKHDKPRGIKGMSKEDRKSKAEERKALRKEKAREKKKAKEEAEKERLKREEHRLLLEKTQTLLRKNPPATTMVRAEDEPTVAEVEVHPEPSGEGQIEDPLETSLVESGLPLVSLNPFEGEDEPIIRLTSGA